MAHGGIEAKMGAKKIEIMKHKPVVTAVRPVRPPSAMPEPDSMKAVTGDKPSRLPTEMLKASVQYAMVERGKSPLEASATPANRAILYSVAVQSRISTYKNVKSANANWLGLELTSQSLARRILSMGWNPTTVLKKSNLESPWSVYGKYVKEVVRLGPESVV